MLNNTDNKQGKSNVDKIGFSPFNINKKLEFSPNTVPSNFESQQLKDKQLNLNRDNAELNQNES
jgi:hypothetical protein